VEDEESRPALEDKELALQGVDVETEADDDSDEEPLPVEASGELAPALTESDEESLFSVDSLEDPLQQQDVGEKLEETLNGFFVEDESTEISPFGFTEEPVDKSEDEISEDPSVELKEESEEPEEEFFTETVETEQVEWLQESLSEESSLEPGPALEGISDDDFPASEKDEESFVNGDEDLFEVAADGIIPDLLPEELMEVGDDVLETEPDQNLDDLFGLEEGVEEASDDDLLFSFPEGEAESDIDSEDGKEKTGEEEVVFELVEDDAEGDEPAEPEVSVFSDETDEIDEVESFMEHVEDGDPLNSLGVCLSSIELELDEKVIQGIYAEINQLRQRWADRTVEKTFLQLLSTVTQHIDRYRLESSHDSFNLLKDNFNALRSLPEKSIEEAQEMLLKETSKVLMWQQELIASQELKINEDNTVEQASGEPVDPEMLSGARAGSEKERTDGTLLNKDPVETTDIHEEIVSLRKILQAEIASLRKELKEE